MPARGRSPPKISLPEDLMEAEIFARLPAKSVLRFRSLSKACNNMTRSTFFIRQHLNHQHPSVLVRCLNRDGETSNYKSTFSMLDINDAEKVTKLSTNMDCLSDAKVTIVGSCNGLLCLMDFDRSPNVYVCNPLIDEVLQLPSITDHIREHAYMSCGLGYDDVTSEFKAVRMIHCLPPKTTVEVLTIQTTTTTTGHHRGQWRRLADLPSFGCSVSTTSVNGRLHWSCSPIGELSERAFILSFDPREEEFQVISIPESIRLSFSNNCSIVELEGCLSLVWFYLLESGNGDSCAVELEVWTMKEYGRSESWIKDYVKTKLYNCPVNGGLLSWTLQRWKDDEILIGFNRVLISYNTRTKTVSHRWSDFNRYFGDSSPLHIVSHVGSLFSLKDARSQSHE